MKEKTVFQSPNYKAYIRDRLKRAPRGEQGRLAEALRCHSGNVSQVLNGSGHFSPEQGVDLNTFFQHSRADSHYFLLLLQHARAGTKALRDYYEESMRVAENEQLALKNRFQIEATVSESDQAIIYSSWHYVAVHMAVLIPELTSLSAIAKYLGISQERVREVLETLTRSGLVKEEGSRLSIGEQRVHLGHDSPFIPRHHANWRLRALDSLDRNKLSDLHYSSVVTLAKSDIPKVREVLVGAIEEIRRMIKPSRDEALYCYCLDLFGLGKD